MNDTSPVDNRIEHAIKPKGQAIQGIDYGIDIMDEKPPAPGGQGAEKPPQSPQPRPRPPQQQSPQPPQHSLSEPQPQSPVSPQLGRHLPVSPGQYRPGGPQLQPPPQSPRSSEYIMPGFGGGNASASPASPQPGAGFVDPAFMPMSAQPLEGSYYQEPELSYEEKRRRKTDALASLARLEAQGYEPAGKKGSHTTDLSELEAMVEKLTAQRDLDNSIKFQRKILVGSATLIESLCENEEYNIFELDLKGWAESIYENISEYDEVFEELYLKYKDTAKIPPEVKLLCMVIGSAWMYNMSRNMFGKASSKVPGFDDVMQHDPGLKKRYQQVATKLARQRGMPVPDKRNDKNGFGFLGQLMGGGNMMAQRAPPPQMPMQQQQQQFQPQQPMQQPPMQQQQAPPARPGRRRVPMEEPHDVDNLLSSLTTGQVGNYADDEMDLSELENISDLDAPPFQTMV